LVGIDFALSLYKVKNLRVFIMTVSSQDSDILAMFNQGLDAHNAGNFESAEIIYHDILEKQPDHPEVNHNIGVLLVAKNEFYKALEFFKFALNTSPNVSLFWASYIGALIKLERIVEAKALVKVAKNSGMSCVNIEAISHSLDVKNQEPSIKDCHKVEEFIAQKKFDEAIEVCLDLMETYPSSSVLNITLGKCYLELGKINLSISCYTKATEYRPQSEVGFVMLGQLYSSQGNSDQAIKNLKRGLYLKPKDSELISLLAAQFIENGDFDGAINYFKKTPLQDSNSCTALGKAFFAKGKHELALKYYRKALELSPQDAICHFNIGNTLMATDSLMAAIETYKQGLKIEPDNFNAINNMGNALTVSGDPNAGIISYKQALTIEPNNAGVLFNLGNALSEVGNANDAIISYKQALKIQPDFSKAYNNLGCVLMKQGDTEASVKNFKQAIRLDPDFVDPYFNMGTSMQNKDDIPAAIAWFDLALGIKPGYENARAVKLAENARICNWPAIQHDRAYIPKLGTTTQRIQPFPFLAFEDAPKNHQKRAEIKASIDFKKQPLPLRPRPIKKPKRLRIGYFSADFHNHATMYLMAKVFEAHDREKFELYAYSFGPDKPDEMRQRLLNSVDVFRDVVDIDDRAVAVLAHQDEIDIAIDLKGYTKFARTEIFAYRTAPLQISYLGYPGTMGADFIDYIIADEITIPEQYEAFYNESIIRLPYSYQATDNSRIISDYHITRSQVGLPEHGFVFCCFNNNYKISPIEFDIWTRLLTAVEGSVLWLIKSNKWTEENLQSEVEKRGISRDRVIFAEKMPHAEHLARHRMADLFIDTFNYNAHTTASDALWAGLPLVTKLGKGFAARVAGSILTAVGLPELITHTEQEYETLILQLATNPKQLAAVKQKLANNRLVKPFFDTELFTKHLEDGYLQAYQLYFDKKNPRSIYVSK
jgi:protein O-GlcNAc transferase